jgi:hypothetical protein
MRCPAEIRTEYIPNTSLKTYRYANLLGSCDNENHEMLLRDIHCWYTVIKLNTGSWALFNGAL